MSETVTPTTTAVDRVIADAKSLPDLIDKIKAVDPSLAESISGKALIQSKTPWGTLAAAIIGWAVARYGLGWDQNVVDLTAGLFVLAGSYVMRYVTKARITGITKPVTQ